MCFLARRFPVPDAINPIEIFFLPKIVQPQYIFQWNMVDVCSGYGAGMCVGGMVGATKVQ